MANGRSELRNLFTNKLRKKPYGPEKWIAGDTVLKLSVTTNHDECSDVGWKMSYHSKSMAS